MVGVDGCVDDINVIRCLDSDLDKKAIEAVHQWKFEPGTHDGSPVPVGTKIDVDFRLD
jgi:TonB family protein